MSGTPVFVGTRVRFQTLIDYLEAGQPLADFLEGFPTVSKEQAIAALEQPRKRSSIVGVLLDECLPRLEAGVARPRRANGAGDGLGQQTQR
jgi:uncharacterized protein (DUF433 family)